MNATQANAAPEAEDQTPSADETQAPVGPLVPVELRALDATVSKLEQILQKLANDDAADIAATYSSKIAVLSAIDDDDIVGPMRAALEQKRDALIRESRKQALARVLATDVGQRLMSLVPARTIEVVKNVPASARRAGTSSTTSDDRIVLSADGREYVRTVISRERAENEIALDEPCNTLGCRFSEILADAPNAKLSGYRMNLTKAISALTSEQIEQHRACMHAAAYATFVVSDAAVSCMLYSPASR
jgi:hypothetical protein